MSRFKHNETTAAVAKICPRCRQPIFTGVSEGVHVRADPYPLDEEREMLAGLAGREIYVFSPWTNHLIVKEGFRWPSGAVLMAHVCFQSLDPLPKTADTQRARQKAGQDDLPPF